MSFVHGVLTVRKDAVGGDVSPAVDEWPVDGFAHNGEVVILIHGFNNDQCEACDAYRKFMTLLPDTLAPIWRFFWPGDADFGWFQWFDFLSYPTEIPDAQNSALRLAAFLVAVRRRAPHLSLTLVGHSLGCRLILELLKVLRNAVAGSYPPITRIMLMAAAVPVELVENGGGLRGAGDLAGERIVFHSTEDLVLQFAFPAGQTLARAMGYEAEAYLEAVGRNGNPPDFPDLSVKRDGNRHGHYWVDTAAVKTLARKLGAATAHDVMPRTTPRHATPPANRTATRSLREYRLAGGEWPGCRDCDG